jgi:hypothetical protein
VHVTAEQGTVDVRTNTTSPKSSSIFFEYFLYLESLLRPEAKSKVPDWEIKSTLVLG